LEDASVLVIDGQIQAVGKDLKAPRKAVVIDLDGRHLTPGIIDCHSHMATDGGVNESTQAITAEVRIGDFIDADDITIYRQLAGGVTTANILHGSANPIGGQNQVIKLRWGALPDEMKLATAPGGIKFALGENVKQANWGDDYTTRYPQTRMGVEQIMRDAFEAARRYRDEQSAWQQTGRGLPPRRDLELEAIAEILEGDRWIEAAKAVKYGGVAPAEALKFVTLNPAKQLRIESRVGSVEVGKDADLVVWSGDPLAITSRVEQTWIDGRRYFDREDDLQARHRDASVRNRLVQKILDSGEEMASAEDREADESELWPREDIFCHGHGHGHGHEHAE
ncbi:hypothetical protein EBU58_08845, partial [bacterium]|nr:hypothetical protein [bacterium]